MWWNKASITWFTNYNKLLFILKIYTYFQCSPREMHLHIDVYDEIGIGGGASGVSGGLLHPYSPKGLLLVFKLYFMQSFHADSSLKIHFTLEILMSLTTSILAAKLLWQGEACWKECLKLLRIAEAAAGYKECNWEVQESEQNRSGFIVRRRLGWRSFLFIPPQMLTGVKTFSYMTLLLCLDASFEIF